METKYSYLKSQNADFIEELFQRFSNDPNSVDETWRYFFEGIELGAEEGLVFGASENSTLDKTGAEVINLNSVRSEFKVYSLIEAYRRFGNLVANTNPLESVESRKKTPSAVLASQWINLSKHGLTDSDLDKKFQAATFIGFEGSASLRDILQKLNSVYCDTIGFEFGHIQNSEIRDWLQNEVESSVAKRKALSKEEKFRVLQKLTEAECFERFLHTRYVAKKRFSVEGGDALLPLLDTMIEEMASSGATDMVLGMAHRGRLNVLTNIFGKKYEYIFAEFMGKLSVDASIGSGDVKYHMGYSTDYTSFSGKKMHISMASNPSHLEFVNPVVEGMVRAKQEREGGLNERTKKKIFPIQIHGDAAFAGQGICYETVQMALLEGYATGGSFHIIVNNQIGFTANSSDSRSALYSSDVMKMMDCPIFHVNGDDAEAVSYVAHLAARFRQKFHQDVVIDLICYRKYGHNEGDEPTFTQPSMYRLIKDHPSPREIYSKKCISDGAMTESETQKLVDDLNAKLNECNEIAKSGKIDSGHNVNVFAGAWKGLRFAKPEDFEKSISTAVDEKTLKEIGKKLVEIPAGFEVHPKLIRLLEQRAQMITSGQGFDWGMGEALAFASLLNEGTAVRVSGQDSERGTFSHRHSVLNNYKTGEKYIPLNNIKTNQAKYTVVNSLLSENAVLGFEYGYGSADPQSLVIWEAQFGDFANGAQVIIDQFIASSEAKWARMTGLVMLLPHGFEGQGPEHSSARLERFLQMCAGYNMQVCNLSTPAQIFHCLRRQVRREFRKPLIIMSPKSLLRLTEAVSSLQDFTQGGFQEVIDDTTQIKNPKRVVLCSGKIYYELAKERIETKKTDIAIVRIEQLYPFPKKQVQDIFKKYSTAKEIVWMQEEPKNMGSWQYIRDYFEELVGSSQKLIYVGRPMSAAPACGSDKIHEKEQHHIVQEAIQ